MEIAFALDTFYAVMAGALVMFMAAGFTMLEAGLVQKKDVSEIVTKKYRSIFNSLYYVLSMWIRINVSSWSSS